MNVLVADDNDIVREMIRDFLNEDEEINVVAELKDGMDVVKTVRKYDVDVVVLDMLMPQKDGMAVVEELNMLGILKKEVHCIVLTAVGEENVYKRFFELGVEYIMLKPFDFNDMKKRVRELGKRFSSGAKQTISYVGSGNDYLEKKIAGMLNEMGFAPNLRGYKYIKAAVLMGCRDESSLDSMTKAIYPGVALEKKTCEAQVERAIRSAIEVTWDKDEGEAFQRVLGKTVSKSGKRPTNGEFIALVVERIRGN